MSIEALDFDALIADKYRPIEWVGKGAMGWVLKAEDVTLDHLPVAIKFLAWQSEGDDEKKRDLFQREMHAMVRLHAHSYIVQVRDFGWLATGTPYMVMGFMPHGSLKDRLEAGQVEPSLKRRVLEELCDALDYIHEQNIVHLDLKPSNILFDRRDHVRIGDFGLARLIGGAPTDFMAAGTPGYMAPEQMRGDVALDHRTDVYALGVIAWQLISGLHPSEPESLSAGTLAPQLAQALRKALAQNPVDRYDSAGEFLKAIKPWLPRTYPAGVVTADARFGFLVTQVPFTYRENVRRVMEDYTTVFGGREPEMEVLDNWLSAPDQSCGIVQAPAGRGKTALLVNWALGVQGSGEWRVVFHPISIRYQTADMNATVRCLAHALAPLFDSEPPGPNQSPDVIRPQVTEWLRYGLPEGEQLLMIVDGLDEAIGWSVESLFPRTPGPGVRLLVSARPLAGTDRLAWTTRLKWDDATARFFDLDSLDRAALTEMLRALPDERLSALVDDDTFVAELARSSEGDPLTARMIVDGLRAGDLTPHSLSRRPPGLKPYLEDWLRELEEISDSEAVWRLLGLCAIALGPLTVEDLAALAPDVFKTGRHIRGAVRAVERFILGDGTPESGYVFSHPRLREFFGDELLASEHAAYQAAFIHYGKRVFDRLPDAPCLAYVRQFWMMHLAEAGEWDRLQSSLLRRDEATGRYLWADMRYAAEGSYSGFLADLARLWHRADEAGDIAVQIESALIEASIHTIANNLSLELLIGLVTIGTPGGKWSIAAALDYIRQMPTGQQQAKALRLIADKVGAPPYPTMLEVVRGIGGGRSRAEALVALIPHLPEVLLSQALAIAVELPEEDDWGMGYQAKALSALAPRLTQELLQEVLMAAQALVDKHHRAKTLAAIASHLPEPERAQILKQAMAVAWEVNDEVERATALAGLSQYLSEPLLRDILTLVPTIQNERVLVNIFTGQVPRLAELDLLEEALAVARAVKSPLRRAEVLAILAPQLVGLEREQVLQEVLAAVNVIDESDRAEALVELAPHLSASLLREALSAARTIENKRLRAIALAGIIPYVSGPEQERTVQEAVAAARAARYEDERTSALTLLLPCLAQSGYQEEAVTLVEELPEVEPAGPYSSFPRANAVVDLVPHLSQQLLSKALHVARRIELGWARGWALAAIAPRLAGSEKSEVLAEAFAAVQVVDDRSSQLGTLAALIPRLAELGCPDEALEFARIVEGVTRRAETLTRLAPHVPEQERDTVLREALEAIRAIEGEQWQAEALNRLVPHLPESLLRDALALARTIKGAKYRAETLISLAPYLPEPKRNAILEEILKVVQAVMNEHSRAEALSRLASYLPEPLLREALAMTRSIEGAKHRAEALISLASCLSGVERDAVLEEALETARAIERGEERAIALATAIPQLPEAKRCGILDEALEAAQGEIQEQERTGREHSSKHVISPVMALSELAPYLTQAKRAAVLQKVMALPEYSYWGYGSIALVHLAPYFSERELEQALRKAIRAAYVDEDYISRGLLLEEIAPLLAELSSGVLHPLWQEMLHTLAVQPRSDLLSDLGALSQVIAALGDAPTMKKIIYAIQNVGGAWL